MKLPLSVNGSAAAAPLRGARDSETVCRSLVLACKAVAEAEAILCVRDRKHKNGESACVPVLYSLTTNGFVRPCDITTRSTASCRCASTRPPRECCSARRLAAMALNEF